MDAIEKYYRLQEQLVGVALARDAGVKDMIFDRDPCVAPLLDELIAVRFSLYERDELEKTGMFGLLATGMFPHLDGAEREAAVCASLELESELTLTRLRRGCARYEETQPLFRGAPGLWPLVRQDRKNAPELLRADPNVIEFDATRQLVMVGGTRARIDYHMRPALTHWLLENFPQEEIFIRLNPFEVGGDLRPNLMEAVTRPADPDWWRDLHIWPKVDRSCRFEVVDCDLRDDQVQWWEYHVRRMGRLEAHFQRRTFGKETGTGEITAMIEELPRPHGDHLVGYMLHLTSDDPVGTAWDEATATHIDGAINVYTVADENKPDKRWEAALENGKVPDATFRTHLFRLDNVPLKSLLPISSRFFRSALLTNEWLAEQFGSASHEG